MGSGTAHVTNGAATRWNVVRKNVGKVRKVKENVRYSSINDYTTSERALENTSLRNVLGTVKWHALGASHSDSTVKPSAAALAKQK